MMKCMYCGKSEGMYEGNGACYNCMRGVTDEERLKDFATARGLMNANAESESRFGLEKQYAMCDLGLKTYDISY